MKGIKTFRMRITGQMRFLVNSLILLLFNITCLSCYNSHITIEAFIDNNSDFSIEYWDGWLVSRHPDHGYIWLEMSINGTDYPRLFISSKTGKEIITYKYNGNYIQENALEIIHSQYWQSTYPSISPNDILERYRWFKQNELDYLYGNSGIVTLKLRGSDPSLYEIK